MTWKKEWKPLVLIVVVFLSFYYLPVEWDRFRTAIYEALFLAKWYAQEHVILCLLPAFFIAGGIAVFVSQGSVMKYLGPTANKACAYGVASCSGSILAVCSCTILPLFAGIYRMGAGLGPATAFLYAGPAINILAIILTARILGPEMGIVRAVGAIVFSVVIGLIMHLIYAREEKEKALQAAANMLAQEPTRPLWQTVLFFGAMIGVLVFANWGSPAEPSGFWFQVYASKWILTGVFALLFAVTLVLWYGLTWWKLALGGLPAAVLAFAFPAHPNLAFAAGIVGLSVITSTREGEAGEWFDQTWGFAKQILPLLLFGVLIAGLLLGRPGEEGLIPATWVSTAVGGNSLLSNFVASFAGAFMYFATLTEIPIVQLVIRSVMGTQKTLVFISLVMVMATLSGVLYGTFF
ncbi:MAG: permease [Desulfovibrionales bacterium]